MIIETAIAATSAMPVVAVKIADARLCGRVMDAARGAGFATVADEDAAQVVIADAMTARDRRVVVVGPVLVLVEAFKRGAAGGLQPDFDGAKFERTLLAVAAGLRCFDLPPRLPAVPSPVQAEHALADEADTAGVPLTARETEVLALMTTGASNKQIARALDFSVHTAKFHVASIIAKLGAKGRTDAVVRVLSGVRDMV